MQLKFYQYSATPNRVDKTAYLTEIGSADNCVYKQDTTLMHPTFILKTDKKVYNANYVYCSTTGRYYYIDEFVAMSGGRMAINCSIDVLYTYRAEILNSSAWVLRSAATTDDTDFDMLHNDYPFRADYHVVGKSATNSIFAETDQNSLPILLVIA